MTEVIFTATSVAFFVLLSYSVQQLAETYWWKIPFLKFLLTISLEERYLLVLLGYSFWLYSCLPFKIRKDAWLDIRIIKHMVILQSMKTHHQTQVNFTFNFGGNIYVRFTWLTCLIQKHCGEMSRDSTICMKSYCGILTMSYNLLTMVKGSSSQTKP